MANQLLELSELSQQEVVTKVVTVHMGHPVKEARYGAVGVSVVDTILASTDAYANQKGKKIACLTRELEATCQANKHERTKTTPCILPTECLMGVVWRERRCALRVSTLCGEQVNLCGFLKMLNA